MKKKSQWIDLNLLRDFEAEGTDAHRLCTIEDGWVERFERDILISHKTDPARDQLILELNSWSTAMGFTFGRIFARNLPKQNAEREAPRLMSGDAKENLQTTAMEWLLRYGIDFGAGYSVGLFVDQRANRRYVRKIAPKWLLNCFGYGRLDWSKNGECRPLKNIAGARERKFRAQRPGNRGTQLYRRRCAERFAAARAQRRKVRRHHS